MATSGLPAFRPSGLPIFRSHSIGGLGVFIFFSSTNFIFFKWQPMAFRSSGLTVFRPSGLIRLEGWVFWFFFCFFKKLILNLTFLDFGTMKLSRNRFGFIFFNGNLRPSGLPAFRSSGLPVFRPSGLIRWEGWVFWFFFFFFKKIDIELNFVRRWNDEIITK